MRGTPTAVAGGQTALSRIAERTGQAAAKVGETLNLPGQLAEFLTKGRYKAPKMDQTIAKQVSRVLDEKSQENRELAAHLASIDAPVKDNRKLVEKLEDPEFLYGNLIGQNAPNLLISMGVGTAGYVAGGPVGGATAAFGSAAGLEGGFARNEAEDFLSNHPDEEMQKLADDDVFLDNIAVTVGVANGVLETLPISKLINRTGGAPAKKLILSNIVKGVASQALIEGGTESIQEIVSNSVAKTYDENRDIFEGVAEAGIGGFLLGGLSSGITDVTTQAVQQHGGFPGLTIKPEYSKNIDNHVQSALQVMDNVEGADQTKVMGRLVENIAAALEHEGEANAAKVVRTLDTNVTSRSVWRERKKCHSGRWSGCCASGWHYNDLKK